MTEPSMVKYLSEKLTAEFGKGYSVQGLRNMRQFYCTFPIQHTLCSELSWSHYRVLMRISDKTARDFYTEECAKAAWSVRQLERQIHTLYYQRLPEVLIKKKELFVVRSKTAALLLQRTAVFLSVCVFCQNITGYIICCQPFGLFRSVNTAVCRSGSFSSSCKYLRLCRGPALPSVWLRCKRNFRIQR